MDAWGLRGTLKLHSQEVKRPDYHGQWNGIFHRQRYGTYLTQRWKESQWRMMGSIFELKPTRMWGLFSMDVNQKSRDHCQVMEEQSSSSWGVLYHVSKLKTISVNQLVKKSKCKQDVIGQVAYRSDGAGLEVHFSNLERNSRKDRVLGLPFQIAIRFRILIKKKICFAIANDVLSLLSHFTLKPTPISQH